MTDREMKKLSRSDLLEMLVQEAEENERLRQEVRNLKEALSNREIKLTNAGSIADASLQLTNVFAEAQKAAEQYLENIRRVDEESQSRADAILREAQERCDRLDKETEERCAKKTRETDTLCAQARRGTQEICARMEQTTREKCEKLEEETQKLCARLRELAVQDAASQVEKLPETDDLLFPSNSSEDRGNVGGLPEIKNGSKPRRGLFSRW